MISVLLGTDLDRSEALLKIGLNEESGVFKYSVSTELECLSLTIIDKAFDSLKQFFEEDLLMDKIQTIEILKSKRDSLRGLIDQKGREYAIFQDRNRGVISNERMYLGNKLLVEIDGLSTAYGEILRSYELTDVSFRDSKPTFMIIDRPFSPLGRSGPSLLLNLILGILLGGFIAVGFIVVRKFYRDIMSSS